ncbi:hypothetical protein CVCC1112_4476 [Paenarthrobacter nicotinovorans]|nr:hypothetical protein CVCC1112_4476 [Paenarthrobacter nicotinovorans]
MADSGKRGDVGTHLGADVESCGNPSTPTTQFEGGQPGNTSNTACWIPHSFKVGGGGTRDEEAASSTEILGLKRRKAPVPKN